MFLFLDERSNSLEQAAFVCYKVVLSQLQEEYERNKELILFALFSLMSNVSSSQLRQRNRAVAGALQYNIKHLLKCLYKYETVAQCPILLVIKTLAVHQNYEQYDVSSARFCFSPVSFVCFAGDGVAIMRFTL